MIQLDEALCRHITHFTTGLLIVHPFSAHQTLLRGSIGAVLAVRTPAHSQDCIATSFAGAQPDCCVAGRLLAGKAYGARMQTNYRFDRVSVMRIQLQAQRYNRRRPRKVMLCRVQAVFFSQRTQAWQCKFRGHDRVAQSCLRRGGP